MLGALAVASLLVLFYVGLNLFVHKAYKEEQVLLKKVTENFHGSGYKIAEKNVLYGVEHRVPFGLKLHGFLKYGSPEVLLDIGLPPVYQRKLVFIKDAGKVKVFLQVFRKKVFSIIIEGSGQSKVISDDLDKIVKNIENSKIVSSIEVRALSEP